MSAFLCRWTQASDRTDFQHTGPACSLASLTGLFRGYLANREDLIRTLALTPAIDDGTVVLAAFQRWGHNASQHLQGEYAAVVYDATDRRLHLLHDELGLVPLFYSVEKQSSAGAVLYVATFVELILAETGVGELDDEYIADYIALGQHLGRRTPYKHIQRVVPGESISFAEGKPTHHATWTVTHIETRQGGMGSDAEEALRAALRSAVRGSLPRSGRTWCELSGGLDSSTVLAFAAQLEPSVEAVSFLSSNRDADERRWMRLVLDQYPVPWHTIPADDHKPFSELPQGPIGYPSPAILTPEIHRLYWQRLEQHGVDTVLTGQAGDAVFLGLGTGPYFLADMLRRGRWRSLATQLRTWQRHPDVPRPLSYWFRRYALGPLLRHARGQMVDGMVVRREPIPWVAPEFDRAHHLRGRTRKSFAPAMPSLAATNLLEGVLRCANSAARFYHRPPVRAHFRHPLFPLPLLRLTLPLPWEEAVQPHTHRILQRRALHGYLPPELLAREDKCGADQNYYDGLEAGVAWQDLLTRDPEIVRRGYVDAARWREGVRVACLGGNVELRFLITFASLEGWLRSLPQFTRQPTLPAGYAGGARSSLAH